MNNLTDFIQEKLKIGSKSKVNTGYHPTTKDELKDLIDKLIQERGNNADLNDIDTSEITDMEKLFYTSKFNGDISEWDVSNVTNMEYMFYLSKFNGDISEWDVSNVTCMNWMFSHSSFTGKNSNLNKWDVSKVRLMNGMFYYSEFEGNIDDWTPPKDFKYNLIFTASPLQHKPPKWYPSK